MSERDDDSDHFGLWLWLVVALVAIVIMAMYSERDLSQIRDLQKRVGQLESGK